ncbi:MAG: hypothetical protein QXR96_03730, partial [Candidatus Woesearchaeota archaeon]
FVSVAYSNLEFSDALLGSDTQQRGLNISTLIYVKNIGNSELKNLAVSFNALSVYNLKYNFSKNTIQPNETIELTIFGYVPLNFNAVDSKGKKKSFKISDLTITGYNSTGSQYSNTKAVYMEAENKLRLTSDSAILINEDESSFRNGKEYDIKRGDKIELSIELENRFSTSGNCDTESSDCEIDTIDLTVESADSDMDVEKDVSFGTLNPNKKSTKKISFSVPDDLEEDVYDFYLYFTGEDENGALHGDYYEFKLNLELENDEITITNVNLFPNEFNCIEKTGKLNVEIKNTGKNEQDEVSIFIDSSKLDLLDSIYNIVLDENEKTTRTFNFELPKNLNKGVYSILVRANYDSDVESDREIIYLNYNCENPYQNQTNNQNNNQNNNNNNQNNNPPLISGNDQNNNQNTDVNIVETPDAPVIYGKEKNSFLDSQEFVFILIILIVIAMVLISVLIGILIKK